MLKHFLLLILLIILVGTVSAVNTNVSVTVDTTVVNSPYLDVNVWELILLLGLVTMFLSHIPGWDKTNPIWACLSPFFTFTALWFSNSIQYVHVNDYYNNATGNYNIVLEHFIYHLDWIAVGLLGVVFVFSCINVAYVLSGKSITKPSRDEIYTPENSNRRTEDE